MSKKHLSGIHVPHLKNTQDLQPVAMPVPARVAIPMLQHMGQPCDVLVAVGDAVQVGQRIGDSEAFLSVPIFSSVSGKVTAIEEMVTPTGVKCKNVVVEPDTLQTPHESVKPPSVSGKEDLLAAMRNAGLVGLGGAGFPTHIKFNPRNPEKVDTLVLNGAECEPYITVDYRAMLDETDFLIKGIEILQRTLGFKSVVLGIEDNKPKAIEHVTKAFAGNSSWKVVSLKSKYPQGAEKVLVYECTGRVIAQGQLPADAGVIVANVNTVIALAKYLETGMPLISRNITVEGDAVANPQNVTALLGTSFADIIEFCGGYSQPPAKLLMGGPMMGITVYEDDMPLIKNNNAVLAFSQQMVLSEFETACIRCGRCSRACPMDLMPRAMEVSMNTGDVQSLKALKADLCIECGCCAFVCPAKRHLVITNKLAKKMLRENTK